MPKMKTHKGTAKRFKVSGSGKLMRRRACQSHILEKKSPKRKRKFKKELVVKSTDEKNVKKLLAIG